MLLTSIKSGYGVDGGGYLGCLTSGVTLTWSIISLMPGNDKKIRTGRYVVSNLDMTLVLPTIHTHALVKPQVRACVAESIRATCTRHKVTVEALSIMDAGILRARLRVPATVAPSTLVSHIKKNSTLTLKNDGLGYVLHDGLMWSPSYAIYAGAPSAAEYAVFVTRVNYGRGPGRPSQPSSPTQPTA